MTKILYVEGDEQCRKQDIARVKRERPDVQMFIASNYDEAVELYDEQGPFDMILSGLVYPGIHREKTTGANDFYHYICDGTDEPRTPFAFFFDPLEERYGEAGSDRFIKTLLEDWCLDYAGVFCLPQCSITHAIRDMERPSPKGARGVGDPLAALRKPEP